MTGSVALNQQDVTKIVRLVTDSNGQPAEGVVAATAGHAIWYRREGSAVVTDGVSAGDLGGLTAAHGDWDFIHIRDGYYRVDYPDSAFLAGANGVLLGMEATGISCIAQEVVIDPIFKFQGHASSVTATTTTFPGGTTPYKGDTIYAIDGTGAKQTRLITSVSGEIATHLAWGINISATTTTVLLIAGDQTIADGGINLDVAVSSRSTITEPQVNSQVSLALASFGVAQSSALLQVLGQLQNAVDTGSQLIVYTPGASQIVGNELFRLNLTKDANGRVTGVAPA